MARGVRPGPPGRPTGREERRERKEVRNAPNRMETHRLLSVSDRLSVPSGYSWKGLWMVARAAIGGHR
jgi:hypothetical protein